jgi:hypothetical protein
MNTLKQKIILKSYRYETECGLKRKPCIDLDDLFEIEEIKQLLIQRVSQRSGLLKALIGKEENATLLNGKKCRLLKSAEESYLIQENHNDKIRWVGISEIDTKSL